ncbi:MAG: APC family permease [Fimbriimonas sp.]|nr:APC family permease [Fimbriimonas sp.]
MSVTSKPSAMHRIRRFLLGAPIPTSRAHHERLSPFLGLPVFSSDSLSSVAYATEAILGVLILGSTGYLSHQIFISIAIVVLIVIIAFSYQQTIHAYPSGGGSYIVASENLGETAGLFAAAALLIDYVLTVSVSIAAGVLAITALYPFLLQHLVVLSLACILGVAYANLRGVRESGAIFAFPTYGFVVSILVMIVFGIWRAMTTHIPTQVLDPTPWAGKESNHALMFIVLRSFAAGCTALTGIEAVSNGVQAFRAPESVNAAKVLRWMAFLLSILFIGISWLATKIPHLSLLPNDDKNYTTVCYQVAVYAFGSAGSWLVYVVQLFTALILILAANTAFADFPRLTSLIARDGYLPRYLARQGDKLVFHNGILLLAAAAGALVVIFKGQLDLLLPLYAIGVFTAFTLSQIGMVVHWLKDKGIGWQRSIVINGIGSVLCAIVLVIIAYTKFTEGAWVVLLLLPIFYGGFKLIKVRYDSIALQLELDEAPDIPVHGHMVLLLVPRVHRGITQALEYATMLKGECQAVHVTINEKNLPDLQRQWTHIGTEVPLVVLPSPFRSLIAPILGYVDELRQDNPEVLITVVVAEAVSTKWYQRVLSENITPQLKGALASRRNVVVANVRYFLN